MTVEYFVNRTSYNVITKRENYRSRRFSSLQDADLYFSETMYRAVAKSRRIEGYTCSISLDEQTNNSWKRLRFEEVSS